MGTSAYLLSISGVYGAWGRQLTRMDLATLATATTVRQWLLSSSLATFVAI